MRSENLSSRKGSLFGISGMWMGMMMKRDIIIAFVAFIAYFLACMFPMLLHFSSFDVMKEYMAAVLSGGFSFVPFITATYAIVLSVMLFDYLHNSASCAEAHSFPLTRGRLFRSSILTGAVLLIIPIALTAVGMFLLGQIMPAAPKADPRAVLSAAACAKWFLDTTLGGLFMFAISNLAGIIAGRNVIHVLLAYLLNGLIGIIFVLIDSYANSFIFGVQGTHLIDQAVYINPFLWYIGRAEHTAAENTIAMLGFVLATVMISVLTGLLYKKVKLEHEQNATVFPVVSDLLVIFCSFCTMSMFSLAAATIYSSGSSTLPVGPFLLASLVSGVASFIVFRMIADSSVRIFHVRSLINFAAFVLVTCVVFAFTCFDVTNQAGKVPAAEDVHTIKVNSGAVFDVTVDLNDKESIDNVIALHKAILAEKDHLPEDSDLDTNHVTIEYTMKDGSKLERSYEIHDAVKVKTVAAGMDKVETGDEYCEKLEKLLSGITLTRKKLGIYTDLASVDIKGEDVKPLVKAYLEDRKSSTMNYYYKLNREDVYDNDESYPGFEKTNIGIISIRSDYDMENDEEYDDRYDGLNLYFGKKNTNVQKFLKDKGYYDEILKAEQNAEG